MDSIPDLPQSLSSLEDPSVAFAGYVMKNGEVNWFCNERWGHFFMNQKEAAPWIDGETVLPWFFMTG